MVVMVHYFPGSLSSEDHCSPLIGAREELSPAQQVTEHDAHPRNRSRDSTKKPCKDSDLEDYRNYWHDRNHSICHWKLGCRSYCRGDWAFH